MAKLSCFQVENNRESDQSSKWHELHKMVS